MTHFENAEQAKRDPLYKEALTELLYQFADDDFILAFRGSEWLGLAPHIEEDVAFSSITQNTMGHATFFYQLLEELGEGDADVLAHERGPESRKSAVYLEKENGDGHYLDEPFYDWALTVVRHYFYEEFKQVKLELATRSSYQPLADAAQKVLMEQPYHLAHWKMWVKQLLAAGGEAEERLRARMVEAWGEFKDVLELGPKAKQMADAHLIAGEDVIETQWVERVETTVGKISKQQLGKKQGSGRSGEHTGELTIALKTLSEVYDTDRTAIW
ncbi:1,2-phenylacetyl-CoA epoxidase subunit PaaC [Salipaludibacillus keqinensis]|nr:1,2-phenylacetyl-CoA epoxidase subunit PaaC [Salipaludibacillus keqinensis]